LASRSTLVVADGDLVAFDLQSGVMRWRSGDSGGGTALHLGAVEDDVVFAGSVNGWLHAVETETGRRRWQSPIATHRPTTVFAPVLAGENIAAAFVDASGEEGGLVMVDRGTGQERWRVTLGSTPAGPAHPAGRPLVTGGLVLLSATDGSIRAWRIIDGVPQWSIAAGHQENGRMPPRDFRPLAVVGRTLVVGSLTGWLVAYDVLTRRLIWRVRPIDASVAFGIASGDEAVYVPYLSGELAALDARTGRERWRTSGLARGFSWTPLVWDGRVYAAASDGGYFAFRR
jgi:outer membrane protein assembly factor BamB